MDPIVALPIFGATPSHGSGESAPALSYSAGTCTCSMTCEEAGLEVYVAAAGVERLGGGSLGSPQLLLSTPRTRMSARSANASRTAWRPKRRAKSSAAVGRMLTQCAPFTPSKQRRVAHWETEAVLDRVQARLDERPDATNQASGMRLSAPCRRRGSGSL